MANDQTDEAARRMKDAADEATTRTLSAMDETMDRSVNMLQAGASAMPEMFRVMSERNIAQARETYARFKNIAEGATDTMEQSFGTAREGVQTVQNKALDAAQANAVATFDFARRLTAATTVADVMQLQAAFLRERFEAFVDYSKDMQATLTHVAEGVSQPARDALSKGSDKS